MPVPMLVLVLVVEVVLQMVVVLGVVDMVLRVEEALVVAWQGVLLPPSASPCHRRVCRYRCRRYRRRSRLPSLPSLVCSSYFTLLVSLLLTLLLLPLLASFCPCCSSSANSIAIARSASRFLDSILASTSCSIKGACAFPCAAAFSHHSTALSKSCATPLPVSSVICITKAILCVCILLRCCLLVLLYRLLVVLCYPMPMVVCIVCIAQEILCDCRPLDCCCPLEPWNHPTVHA